MTEPDRLPPAVSASEMSEGLFRATGLTEPRYVWDPMVHREFGEDCYFLLMRLREQRGDVLDAIADLADDVDIRSISIYKVYGHYDILVRVWTTNQKFALLGDALHAISTSRAEVKVDEVFYDDWTIHHVDIDSSYLVHNDDAIRTLTSVRRYPTAEEINRALTSLVDARLLHFKSPSAIGLEPGAAAIKFFLALSPTSPSPDPDRDLMFVRNAQAALTGLKLKSLYWSRHSRIACFITGVVPAEEFGLFEWMLAGFEEQLRSSGVEMRMETMVVASSGAPECNTIATDLAEASGTRWDQLTRHITTDAAKFLRQQSQQTLDRMYRIFEDFRADALYKTFEGRFRDVLNALALGSGREFQMALMFLPEFEGMLRNYLTRQLWPRELGAEWHAEVRAALASDGGESRGRNFSVGDLSHALGKLVSDGRLSGEIVAEALGPEWSQRLEGAIPVRNLATHGGATEVEWHTDATGPLSAFEVAAKALAVGEMYNRLSDRADTP